MLNAGKILCLEQLFVVLLFNPAQSLPSFPGLWYFSVTVDVITKLNYGPSFHNHCPGFHGHLRADGKDISSLSEMYNLKIRDELRKTI